MVDAVTPTSASGKLALTQTSGFNNISVVSVDDGGASLFAFACRMAEQGMLTRNLHGHHYTLLITLTGNVVQQNGQSDNGMTMDFGDLKTLANEHLVKLWDHAFTVYEKDTAVRAFLDSMPEHKTVIVDRLPTVENLAKTTFDILKDVYHDRFGRHLVLTKVTMYETPNCWAEVEG